MSKASTGLPRTIAFEIPTWWTSEQAFAVVELLDDLRDKIWAYYDVKLLDEYREQYAGHSDQADTDDPPF